MGTPKLSQSTAFSLRTPPFEFSYELVYSYTSGVLPRDTLGAKLRAVASTAPSEFGALRGWRSCLLSLEACVSKSFPPSGLGRRTPVALGVSISVLSDSVLSRHVESDRTGMTPCESRFPVRRISCCRGT